MRRSASPCSRKRGTHGREEPLPTDVLDPSAAAGRRRRFRAGVRLGHSQRSPRQGVPPQARPRVVLGAQAARSTRRSSSAATSTSRTSTSRTSTCRDDGLARDATAATRRKIEAAGLTIMGGGTITLKNDPAQIRSAFEYARAGGFPLIVAAPEPAALDAIEAAIKEFDIKVGIHNHGPEDKFFPAPQDAYKLLKGRDPRFGLCMDIGHATRAGVDPVKATVRVPRPAARRPRQGPQDQDGQGQPVRGGQGGARHPRALPRAAEDRATRGTSGSSTRSTRRRRRSGSGSRSPICGACWTPCPRPCPESRSPCGSPGSAGGPHPDRPRTSRSCRRTAGRARRGRTRSRAAAGPRRGDLHRCRR